MKRMILRSPDVFVITLYHRPCAEHDFSTSGLGPKLRLLDMHTGSQGISKYTLSILEIHERYF